MVARGKESGEEEMSKGSLKVKKKKQEEGEEYVLKNKLANALFVGKQGKEVIEG